jgi:hypothetical protein
MTQSSWASAELVTADIGDQRLNRRLVQIVKDLSAMPGSSIPQASQSWKATKACYNFLGSEKVMPEKILQPHQQSTRRRMAESAIILAVQDTSSLNFTSHRKTTGLGYLQNPTHRGMFLHTSLGITPSGEILGVLSQHSWVRPDEEYGKKHQRRSRSTSEKETQRWLDVQQEAFAAVAADVQVIAMADREADFYEFFASDRPSNADVLIRATHNRRLDGECEYLHEAIEQMPESTQMSVTIARANERPERQARLSIRYQPVRMLAPRNRRTGDHPASVEVTLLLAREIDQPAEGEPIEWWLLTTMLIDTPAQAIACVGYYSQRWLIERFHFTLKSGCAIEQLQLESVERLRAALAVMSIVAWRLLWLLYHSRAEPSASAQEFLQPHEWQVLYVKEHPGQRLPSQPPTLQQAVLWIAKLGGFLARTSDGLPGIKTLWRGLRRLNDIADTWKLAQNSLPLMGNA